ncbi:copper-binding transcription factor, partial [Ascosphaera pollenicola]
MSNLTVPSSKQNPRRTVPRPRKTSSLAKANTFNATRSVVSPEESGDELEGLDSEHIDVIMDNNDGNAGGCDATDKKNRTLDAPVFAASRVLTRSHTDVKALESALKEGSRSVDLLERLEKLNIDDEEAVNKEARGPVKGVTTTSHKGEERASRRNSYKKENAVGHRGSGTSTPSAGSDCDSDSESISPSSNPPLSAYAGRQIESHILLPLLRRKELATFVPLIRSLPRRIQSGEITTLRDLERTLFGLSVNFAISKAIGRNVYTAFANYTIQCLHATVPVLCERELKSDGERAYSGIYFLDLVEQVRQYAAVVGRARVQRAAAVVKSLEDRLESDDIILVNGIANSGRPAELIRRTKDGRMFSLSTGKPYFMESAPSKPQEKTRPRPPMGKPTLDESPTRQLREARARISRNPEFVRLVEARIQYQAEAQRKTAIKANPAREAGVKRSLDVTFPVSADEPPSDVSRSMARRKKGEAPMDVKAHCRYCNRRFRRPCDLTKHMKTHTRPYKCPEAQCKYHEIGWPTEKERDRHVNDKHSKNPRLYHCDFGCGYQSKRESNCKQHMEKTHAYTYERTKRCSTSKKPSIIGNSAIPTIAVPDAQMRLGSIAPTTPASSNDGKSMPHTPVSGYTSANTPAPFSAFPTPASLGRANTTPATTPESHGSISGSSSASTPSVTAAQGVTYENGMNDGSIASNTSQKNNGQGQSYQPQLGALDFAHTIEPKQGDFSLFQNGNPFAAQGSEPQNDTTQQKPSFEQLTNPGAVPQLSSEPLPMGPLFMNNTNTDANAPLADATCPTSDYYLENLGTSANALWNGTDLLNTSNDLSNFNVDFSTNFGFGDFSFGASTTCAAAGLPNDFYSELSPYEDNMEIDTTEINQEAALFYQNLQQILGENNTANNTPIEFQGSLNGKPDQPASNLSWNGQQPAQQHINQQASQNPNPVQTAQNGFGKTD